MKTVIRSQHASHQEQAPEKQFRGICFLSAQIDLFGKNTPWNGI
jgi:hypothetical protein